MNATTEVVAEAIGHAIEHHVTDDVSRREISALAAMAALTAVQQPNRDAMRRAIEGTEVWRVFGFNIEPVLDAVLAALAVPATGETATQYRAVWPGGSVSMPLPSPTSVLEHAERNGLTVTIESRTAHYTPWVEVTP